MNRREIADCIKIYFMSKPQNSFECDVSCWVEWYQDEAGSERVQHYMAGSFEDQARGFHDTDTFKSADDRGKAVRLCSRIIRQREVST